MLWKSGQVALKKANMERMTDYRDTLLCDLPSDALHPAVPYCPQLVINLDELHGTKSSSDYLRELAKVRHDIDAQLAVQAARDGYGNVAFTKSYSYRPREKEAGLWPMVMASALVQEAGNAKKTNALLIAETCSNLGIKSLRKNCMSEPLTKGQRAAVAEILENHGHSAPKFKTMTDVKRLVKARGERGEQSAPVDVRLSVHTFGKSIVIGGHEYALQPRRGKPNGDPLHDLCIRVHGAYVPLVAAMQLLGIPDDKACSLVPDAA